MALDLKSGLSPRAVKPGSPTFDDELPLSASARAPRSARRAAAAAGRAFPASVSGDDDSTMSIGVFSVASTASMTTDTASVAVAAVSTTAIHDADDDCEFVNEYMFEEEIGRGAEGRVVRARDTQAAKRRESLQWHREAAPLSDLVAIKIIRRPKQAVFDVATINEAEVVRRLRHRNIVTIREIIDDPANELVFIVMDYIPGGVCSPRTKEGEFKVLPLEAVIRLLMDVARALRYLHRNNIIHRDVKPDNILDCDDRFAVTDFGLAECRGSGCRKRKGTGLGTTAFLAPELFDERARPTAAGDMWALGITLMCVCSGKLPWSGPHFAIREQIKIAGPEVYQLPAPFAVLQPMLDGLCQPNPVIRMTSKQLRDHRVLQQLCGDAMCESTIAAGTFASPNPRVPSIFSLTVNVEGAEQQLSSSGLGFARVTNHRRASRRPSCFALPPEDMDDEGKDPI